MHALFPGGKLFGLGAPELIVILILLLVMYSGHAVAAGRESAPRPVTKPSRSVFRQVIGYGVMLFGFFLAFRFLFMLLFPPR